MTRKPDTLPLTQQKTRLTPYLSSPYRPHDTQVELDMIEKEGYPPVKVLLIDGNKALETVARTYEETDPRIRFYFASDNPQEYLRELEERQWGAAIVSLPFTNLSLDPSDLCAKIRETETPGVVFDGRNHGDTFIYPSSWYTKRRTIFGDPDTPPRGQHAGPKTEAAAWKACVDSLFDFHAYHTFNEFRSPGWLVRYAAERDEHSRQGRILSDSFRSAGQNFPWGWQP